MKTFETSRGIFLVILFLLQGCATPMPVSDLLIHSQGSRLKGELGHGRAIALRGQINSVSRSVVMGWVEERFRKDPLDSFEWMRSDARGVALGVAVPVIPDRVTFGVTSGWLMVGADVTAALPLRSFLTLSYAWKQQGSILLQRRLWSHPNVSLAAGGFYRRDILYIMADYAAGDPDAEVRECDWVFCGLGYPDQESIDVSVIGGRLSGMVRGCGPECESSVYTRFTLEAGYAPNVASWIVSGALSFVMP